MSECQRGEGAGWPHEESGMGNPEYRWYTEAPSSRPYFIGGAKCTDGKAIQKVYAEVCGHPWKNWVFLLLETGDGLQGTGECSLNGFAVTTVACIEELSRYFLGKRPEDYAAITARMLTDLYSDAGQLHRGVIAAVEMACLDILGKRAGLPVYALLGGKVRDEIPAYANGWYRVERTPKAFTRVSINASLLGYAVAKCDPFGHMRSPLTADGFKSVQDILANFSAWADANLSMVVSHGVVHGILPPGTPEESLVRLQFAAECHQRLNYPDSLKFLSSLPKNFLWIEEPLPWWDLDGLARLADTSPVPVATGENLTSVRQFEDLVSRSRNLILQPDVMNLGGITQALAVCRLAERHGLRVCPHDAQGPVSRAACVQLAALSPAVWMLEDFDPWNAPWTHEIATTYRAEKGVIGFKEMPSGLGVTLHWDKVREHPYDPNGWVPLFEAGWERRRSEAP